MNEGFMKNFIFCIMTNFQQDVINSVIFFTRFSTFYQYCTSELTIIYMTIKTASSVSHKESYKRNSARLVSFKLNTQRGTNLIWQNSSPDDAHRFLSGLYCQIAWQIKPRRATVLLNTSWIWKNYKLKP